MSDRTAEGLGHAARVMLGDRAAPAGIDGSREGVRRSFLGVAMGLVIGAGLMAAGARIGGDVSPFQAFVRSIALGVASYAAAVAVVIVLVRDPAQRARIPLWLAARNWGEAVLASVLLVPTWILVSTPSWRVDGAEVSGSPALASALVLGIVAVDLVAHYRLLTIILGLPGLRAFWTVIAANIASAMASLALG